jgi:hypothetical protein
MNNEPINRDALRASQDRRLADLRATTTTMPDRPTDRSRNGMRAATRRSTRRIIR